MRKNSFKSSEYFIRHEKDGCPFSDHYDKYKYRKCYDLDNRFKLTKTEQIILAMYLQNDSSVFRGDTYKKPIPKWAIKLFNILDNIIRKTSLNKDKTLYRFCNEYDDSDLDEGNIIRVQHNLTCTQKKIFIKNGKRTFM